MVFICPKLILQYNYNFYCLFLSWTMTDLVCVATEAPSWVVNATNLNETFDLHKRETLTLQCGASGVPPPTYHWNKVLI